MLRNVFACAVVTLGIFWQTNAPAAEPDGASLNGALLNDGPLNIEWAKNYLTIDHQRLPGPISIHYLEAYCRPG